MQLRNDRERYGLVAVLLHWLMALAIFAMFGLGLWMTDLTYYDTWYHRGPWLHKGIGVLLFLLLLLRLGWRMINPRPGHLASHTPFERRAASIVHWAMYLLLFAVFVTGYLMDTAEGHPVDVFGWFSVPATLSGLPRQADVAGAIHLWLAVALVAIAALHAAAALKHHFIDKDRTMRRMFGR